MKKLLLIFNVLVVCSLNAQAPAWEWAKGSTTSSSGGSGVATDGLGNVYFSGTFGNPPFTVDTYTLTDAGSYLAKASPAGNISWIKNIINAHIRSIAIDANNNTFIAGILPNGSASYFDNLYLYGDGFTDVFIAKYDANGNAIWAKKCGGNYYDEFNSMVLDANANPIITGYFSSDSIMFDNIAVMNTDVNHNSNGLYVAKYDANGNALWGHTAIGNYDVSGCNSKSVATDGSNIYIAGHFDCTSLTFGSYTLNRSGSNDAFLTKYDANGNLLWAKRYGGNSSDEVVSIACDSSGNIIMGGQFKSSSVVYGTTTVTHTGTGTNYSSLFVKCDANGDPQWAQAEENSQVYLVSTDDNNNYYFAGLFVDSLVLGSTHLIGPGGRNTFIAKKDISGNDVWAKSVYTPMAAPSYNNMLRPVGLSQKITNEVYLTGALYGQDCYLDSLYLLNPNASSSIMFLAKINEATIGIEDLPSELTSEIFPNPTNGILYLKNLPHDAVIKVFSVDGKFLKTEFNDNNSTLNLEVLPAGVYYITIDVSTSKITKKVVVLK